VAEVDAAGFVTGVGEGTAAIVARIGDLAASADVAVSAASVADAGPDDPAEADPPGPGPLTGGGETGPILGLRPDRVLLASIDGEGVEPASVELTGEGIAALSTAVAYPGGGASGWLNAELSGTSTPARLELRVDPDAVPVGEHAARVDVSVAGRPTATIQVTYAKDAVPAEDEVSTDFEGTSAFDDLSGLLDRQERLLEDMSPEAYAAVGDTAGTVWGLRGAPDDVRARAAFYAAQAAFGGGDRSEARVWAERAVELAPANDGYRILLEQLTGGAP
jgi:hypothetical protein